MTLTCRRIFFLALTVLLCHAPLSAQTATATTLSILSGSAPVTTVPAGTVLTLSATVTGGSSPITGGTVYFCDSIFTNCASSPIATAQVVNGTAAVKAVLAPGSYTITTKYSPRTGFSGSTSPTTTLNITNSSPTTTTLTKSSQIGATYGLNTTVEASKLPALTGTVTLNDTTSGTVLASGTLPSGSVSSLALTLGAQPAGDSRGACTTVTGDFNADGYPDIAIGSGCQSQDGLTSPVALQILLGHGDGTFTPGPAVPSAMTNTNVTGLTVGDFNNDGTLDLIASDNIPDINTPNYGAHLHFLANDGTGTFTASQLSPSCSSSQMVTADFNQDGNLDFAAECSSLEIFLGTGTGTFTPYLPNIFNPYGPNIDQGAGISPPLSQNGYSIADFNNDGYPDIVAITNSNAFGGSYAVSVFTSYGTGVDFTREDIAPFEYPLAIAALDFNGDGNTDIIGISQSLDHLDPTGYSVSHVITGTGHGTFSGDSTGTTAGANASGTSITTADFNHDGVMDYALFTFNSITVQLGSRLSSAAVATLPLNYSVTQASFPSAAADFNGDGLPDLVASSSDQSNAAIYTVGGSFSASLRLSANVVGNGTHAVSATYSGDGAYATSTSSPLNLDGGSLAPSLSLTASPNPSSIGTQVTLTATLQPYNAGSLSTNGDIITFNSGNVALGTAMLNNGIAALNLTNLPLGPTSVTARFPGDTNFSASTSIPVTVTVTTIPAPTVNPAVINFGTVHVDSTTTLPITVTNTATGPLAITSIQSSTGFSQTNDCGSSLAGGSSCTVTVTFAPTSPITATGTVTITTNASTPTTTVALNANAIVYPTVLLTVSPTSTNVVTPVTYTATITPSSSGSFTANGLDVIFVLDPATTSTAQVINGKATFTTTYGLAVPHPVYASFAGGPGFAGANSNTVIVNVTDISTPTTSPNPVIFGTVGIGSSVSQNVTITNTDTVSPLAIASVQISSGFSLVNHCGSSLAVGASCTATVTFAPTTATTTNGTLTFNTNANYPTRTVTITGTGVAPTLSLTALPASAPTGAPVILTATLAPYSAGTLSTNGKTVTFTKGGATLGTGTLTNGVATLSLTSLPLGSNSITATFTGDANFASVTSSATSVTISAPPAPTVSPTSISFGALHLNTPTTQPLNLTNTSTGPLTIASIVAGSGFTQTNTCGGSVAAGASCTITVSFTATSAASVTGTLSITTNASAPITTVALSGSGIASALYLTASPASVSLGTQVALSATLTPYTNGSTSSNGKTVTFASGGGILGTATLNNGTAVLNTSTLPVGSNAVTATFTGDANFTSATSNSATVTVAGLTSTLHLAASPTSASLGNPVALTATLSPYSSGSLTTNGKTVTFTKGSTTLGTATLANGTAVLNLTTLPLGSNAITASFTGDTNFASATSSAATVTITGPTAPTVTPTSVNFGAITLGSSVSQTVTLTNNAAGPLTVSAVTINGGFTQTNTCGVLAVSASCTATVTYAPTATGAANGTLTFTTNAVTPTTTVSLSGSGAAAVSGTTGGGSLPTIKPGASTSLPVSFTTAPGVTGTLNTTCSVKMTNGGTANYPPTCSTAPASIPVTGGSTVSTTVIINTTGSSAAMHLPASGIALAGGLLGLLVGFRRRPKIASFLMLLLSLTIISAITGCGTSGGGISSGGGGSSSGGGSGNSTPSTTAGAYTVTVTATLGTQTSSVDLPLTIQ